MRIDLYHHDASELEVLLRSLDRKLDLMIRVLEVRMATLDEVLATVTANGDRIDSLGEFIAGLKQQIEDALSGVTLPPAVQAKVDAVFTELEQQKAQIDAALNTGVPPAPPA